MSDPSLNVDDDSLKQSKEKLEHVEPKRETPSVKSVLACPGCSHTEDVPAEWADMDETPELPNCPDCGQQMAIKIV